MAHTNETVNYHLSQFVGTDIPNPLVDYNGDMGKIDTAIKNVADSAVSESGRITALETQNGSEVLTTTAQTLSGAVNELDGEVGAIDTRLTTAEGKITADEGTLATAVGNISTLAGKVSAVETKVGTAVLTTTASDLSGAVNELDSDIATEDGKIVALQNQNGSEVLQTVAQTLSGAINELHNATPSGVDADDVSYDNTDSGLTATNVQDAIDEVYSAIPSEPASWTLVGTQTGTTAITLPADFSELYIEVQRGSDSVFCSTNIIKAVLSSTAKTYAITAGSSTNTSSFAAAVNVSSTSVALDNVTKVADNITASSTVTVYAK